MEQRRAAWGRVVGRGPSETASVGPAEIEGWEMAGLYLRPFEGGK